MAKELPYFRFTVSEWLNDDISIESYAHKGAFIDACAYYWSQDCDLTLAKLKKKFSNATSLLTDLVSIGVIKHESRHDKIKIEFLDSQYDLLSEKRKARQSAGSKGGNATAMLKQKGSYKDKDKDNNNDKDNIGEEKTELTPFEESLEKFYKFRKEKKKPILNASKELFLKKLTQLSNGEESAAIQILEQSIANGWQGIFPIKTENNGKQESPIQAAAKF